MILGETQLFASPEEALAHFGVKGMRWGVRKRDTNVGAGEGAATLAVLGVVYAGIALHAAIKGARERKVMRDDSGEQIQKLNTKVAWKTNPELSKKMNVSDLYDKVVVPVNPKYGAPGTKMNCRRCTMAYEMRRRGIDVKATKSIHASGQDLKGLMSAVKDTSRAESRWGEKTILKPGELGKLPVPERSRAIFNHLSQHPEGARGELAVGWTYGGGHSMAWEVVGGKPIIFDAQTKWAYHDADAFETKARAVYDAGYTRTDNKKLDEDFLKRWMENND